MIIKYFFFDFFFFSRTLSTLNSAPLAASTTVASKADTREFMSVFPGIC